MTVHPGWYRGRTVHMHPKAHLDSATLTTTRLYFDEAVTEQVYAQAPHHERTGRDTFNDDDALCDSGGGAPLLTLSPVINVGVTRT